jgi:16S rRNA (guanine966-N2)-methyltransferase
MPLRVVAGTLGGRRLVAPKGAARPTTDRLKEALFAALGPGRLAGATVLDLYAGSGALAIEALSRGADRAVLVDRDAAARTAIRANVTALGLDDRARFQRSTVSAFLGRPIPEAPFDVVFLDPPYETPAGEVGEVLSLLVAANALTAGATVVIERPKAGEPVPIPLGWHIGKERSSGDTLLLVATA